ncbi:MAG: class I SAM-dependent methyltransferase, partial [Clostridia bacterium]|nr:class I SAM-dependent methyltransferase [Clostridia bacterium]
FTLCDSIGKKIIVATEVCKGLELKNVKTVNARAESLPEQTPYKWCIMPKRKFL